MKIDIISKTVIKIELEKDELNDLDLSFDELDRKDIQTQAFILDIIDIIQNEKGIDLSNERLFLEAFPFHDGGCIIYISIFEKDKHSKSDQKSNLSHIALTTDSIDNLIEAGFFSKRHLNEIIRASSLYIHKNSYLLILSVLRDFEEKLYFLLTEFFDSVETSKPKINFIREHYLCIKEKDAIEVLSLLKN